jgi:hypothetical protein
MKRSTRVAIAQETVAIVERGSYVAPSGRTVDIADAVRACLDGTRHFTPEDLKRLRKEVLTSPSPTYSTRIEVAFRRHLLSDA